MTCTALRGESRLLRRTKPDRGVADNFTEYLAMNTKTFGSQLENRSSADAHSPRRALLIKKARENVQASHQRMQSRLRKTRV